MGAGASRNDNGFKPFEEVSGQDVSAYRGVKSVSASDDTKVQHTGAGEGHLLIGTRQKNTVDVDGNFLTVKLLNASGTHIVEVSGAVTAGQLLYCAANGKFTATQSGEAVFIALRDASGDGAQIEALPLSAVGGGSSQKRYVELFLGAIPFGTTADGDLRTGYKMPVSGRIKELYCHVKTVCVGSGGTIDINLEKGGTNLTGGVLTYSTASMNTLGERVEATAITDDANNLCAKGDLIDVEGASAGGTRTSGEIELYALVEVL